MACRQNMVLPHCTGPKIAIMRQRGTAHLRRLFSKSSSSSLVQQFGTNCSYRYLLRAKSDQDWNTSEYRPLSRSNEVNNSFFTYCSSPCHNIICFSRFLTHCSITRSTSSWNERLAQRRGYNSIGERNDMIECTISSGISVPKHTNVDVSLASLSIASMGNFGLLRRKIWTNLSSLTSLFSWVWPVVLLWEDPMGELRGCLCLFACCGQHKGVYGIGQFFLELPE